MRILLTGASGMLANDIIPVLKRRGDELLLTDVKPRVEGITAADIADLGRVRTLARDFRPDYIFHLAAETNVDLCEQKPDHAFRINRDGTRNIVSVCKEAAIKLLY